MNTDDVSPSRQQYLEIKRAHPNTILFFRLGDFYETFDEDAEITARELDIVLTSRTVGKGQRAPLAGIPYHAVKTIWRASLRRAIMSLSANRLGIRLSKGSSHAKSFVL